MHDIRVTEGLVLEKRAAGEANALVSLLTREFGLLRASARSARLERSKLRYGLEPLTSGRFSLVRGKREWRLVGVERADRALLEGAHPGALGRVTRLLLRLVAGEEPQPALFDAALEGFSFLARVRGDLAEAAECVLVLRLLARLGYVPATEALAPFISDDFSFALSAQALASRALLVRAINESLRQTGL